MNRLPQDSCCLPPAEWPNEDDSDQQLEIIFIEELDPGAPATASEKAEAPANGGAQIQTRPEHAQGS